MQTTGVRIPLHLAWGTAAGIALTSPIPTLLIDFTGSGIGKQLIGACIEWILVGSLVGTLVGWAIKRVLDSRIRFLSYEHRRNLLVATCATSLLGLAVGFGVANPQHVQARQVQIEREALAKSEANRAAELQARLAAEEREKAKAENLRLAKLTPSERKAEVHAAACKSAMDAYVKCEALCGDQFVSCIAKLTAPENCEQKTSLQSMYEHASCKH